MKKLILILIGLNLTFCQNTKTGMTKEEFETKIEIIEKENIANKRLANGWYTTLSKENEFKRLYNKTSDEYFINPKPIVLPDNFSISEEYENNQGVKTIAVYFDQSGTDSWSKATDYNIGLHLIFILDNEILSAPLVNSQITNGASAFWKNELTEKQWKKIKEIVTRKTKN
ncbi:SecDF P1 head subdomain-containing protein [Aureibaculum conchae]|uniref:SecDF P1 head subdomain-containing protein n=1 Tax=Aureibaculum sp. 2308TA14-22 TaxID=3108392 RepID=UPI003392D680